VSASRSPDYVLPDWPAPANVRALITTRTGGVSAGPYASLNLGAHVGDDSLCVQRNRALLRSHLPAEPRWMKQVHGTHAVEATEAQAEPEPEPEADAAFARTSGVVCAVLTADCLPVFLCDRAGSRVGIAHAGWRGLASGVIESLIRAMSVSPDALLAYLGPAIGPAAFEVGEDVRTAFVADDAAAHAAFAPRGHGKYGADLYALARGRLAAAGVSEVYGGGFCTHSEPRFYSFRRERITGRMASLIWLASDANGASER
jgi:YfiH family protein